MQACWGLCAAAALSRTVHCQLFSGCLLALLLLGLSSVPLRNYSSQLWHLSLQGP